MKISPHQGLSFLQDGDRVWPESIWFSPLTYFCCFTSLFLPFCPHYRAWFQATTVSNSPTLGLTHTQMLTGGTASKINFYGWMALPHNSHNDGDNGLKPGLLISTGVVLMS